MDICWEKRTFIIGSDQGQLSVHQFPSGVLVNEFTISAGSPIESLQYCPSNNEKLLVGLEYEEDVTTCQGVSLWSTSGKKLQEFTSLEADGEELDEGDFRAIFGPSSDEIIAVDFSTGEGYFLTISSAERNNKEPFYGSFGMGIIRDPDNPQKSCLVSSTGHGISILDCRSCEERINYHSTVSRIADQSLGVCESRPCFSIGSRDYPVRRLTVQGDPSTNPNPDYSRVCC